MFIKFSPLNSMLESNKEGEEGFEVRGAMSHSKVESLGRMVQGSGSMLSG